MEKSENLQSHRTEGFSSSKTLVVRRGAPLRISLQLEGRPFDPQTDSLRIKVMLGTHTFTSAGMNGCCVNTGLYAEK